MTDNVAITAGAGTSIATDDIGGVHYQRVKVTYGADGSATDPSSTAPFPIAWRYSHSMIGRPGRVFIRWTSSSTVAYMRDTTSTYRSVWSFS